MASSILEGPLPWTRMTTGTRPLTDEADGIVRRAGNWIVSET